MSVDTAGTVLEVALAEVARFDQVAEDAQRERDEAQAAIERIEPNVGRMVLEAADPGEGERITSELARLRSVVAVQGAVIEEAASRAAAGRRVALAAEAEEMAPEIDAARRRRDEPLAGVAERLQALEEFAGRDYVDRAWDSYTEAEFRAGVRTGKLPGLELDVRRLETARALLLAAADGLDLRTAVPAAYEVDPFEPKWFRYEDLPMSLRPGGLAPAPGFSPPADPALVLVAAEQSVRRGCDGGAAGAGAADQRRSEQRGSGRWLALPERLRPHGGAEAP